MTELIFITGGSIRKVFIDKKVITFLTAELNYAPMTIDLNKLDSPEMQEKIKNMKMKEEDVKLIKELASLNDEKEIIKDIKKDFQSKGWRLVKQK